MKTLVFACVGLAVSVSAVGCGLASSGTGPDGDAATSDGPSGTPNGNAHDSAPPIDTSLPVDDAGAEGPDASDATHDSDRTDGGSPGADATGDAALWADAQGTGVFDDDASDAPGPSPDGQGTADASGAADTGPSCTDDDAGCDTGNPGACAAGTLVCEGGAPVCVPAATTQACYGGPAGTAGVGICHGGTQSCIGMLGTCTDEVVPAARENCFNTTDDDCDGVTNNGCPSSFAWGPDRVLAGAGGMGGAAQSVHCPAGAFVTRVDSWFDDNEERASGVSIYCATPSLSQGTSSYAVTVVPDTPAPYATVTGSTALDQREDDCGTADLTAVTYTVGLADTSVEGLGNHCGTSAVTLAADNMITFDFVGNGAMDYSAFASSPGTFFDQSCNSNEVVVGFDVRVGAFLDFIAPICEALTVTYVP